MSDYSLAALIGVARTLGRSHNIDVTVSGSEAFSGRDNKGKARINIPVLADNPDAFTLARGYIDHEAAHALLTDFDAEKDATVDADYKGALHSLVNIYEDARIERRIGNIWPGCRKNLARLNDLLFTSDDSKGKRTDTWQRITNWLLLESLAQNQASMRPLADAARKHVPAQLVPILSADAAASVSCPDTSSVVTLALHTLDAVRQYAQGNQGNQGNQGSTGDKDSKARAALDTAMQRDKGNDKGTQMEQALADNSSGKTSAPVPSAGNMPGAPFAVRDLSDKDLHESLSAAAALSARMQTLFQAQTLERRLPSRHGRLNTRALHRAGMDARLFLAHSETVRVNTEVILLCDTSGSMDGRPAQLMSQATYALMRCLRSLPGITSSVYAYNTAITSVLRPSQPLTRRMSMVCSGGTETGKALLFGLQAFGHERKRRILIVLTDGATYDDELMRDTVAAAPELGVELYGIDMGTDALEQYALPSQTISTLAALPDALFRIIHRGLV